MLNATPTKKCRTAFELVELGEAYLHRGFEAAEDFWQAGGRSLSELIPPYDNNQTQPFRAAGSSHVRR